MTKLLTFVQLFLERINVPKKRRINISLSEEVHALLQDASERANVRISDIISEILERVVKDSGEETLENHECDESIEALLQSMTALRDMASNMASSDLVGSMNNYLLAASIGLEVMANIDRKKPDAETQMLKLLMTTLDSIRKGTGYTKLPDVPVNRAKLSAS